MANLVDRLCQVETDESGRNMALLPWFGALIRVLDGRHTVNQIKNFYAMNAADEAQFDTMVAAINDGVKRPTLAHKVLAILNVYAILTIWEVHEDLNAPPYSSVAAISDELLGLNDHIS